MTRLGLRICIQSALICIVAAFGGQPWLALLGFIGAMSAAVQLLACFLILFRAHRRYCPRSRVSTISSTAPADTGKEFQ